LIVSLHDLYSANCSLLKIGKVRSHLELLDLFHGTQRSCPGSNPTILNADVPEVALQVVFLLVHDVIAFLVSIIVVVFICFVLAIFELFLFIFTVFFLCFLKVFFASSR